MKLQVVLAMVAAPFVCDLIDGAAVAGSAPGLNQPAFPQSCAALGYPAGVCAATWDAIDVWNLQHNVGTRVGAPSATVFKNAVTAWFRGSIANGVLTVTGAEGAGGPSCPYSSGQIAAGQYIYGPNIPAGTYIQGAGPGSATCGGSASGYGQDNSSWTLSDNTLTVGSEIMVSGGSLTAGAELPTASANCGMPWVPIHANSRVGNHHIRLRTKRLHA